MNNFSLYTFRLYHYLLTVRDTLEYSIKREHKIEVYEARKKILTENLNEGTPFGDFLKNNGETGDKIKERINSFIEDLYSENSTILMPSGQEVRVDVGQVVTLYDMTVGVTETLRDIVYQYINYGLKNEDVDPLLVQLVSEDERMYRLVLSMLVMRSFQESFAEFQKVMNESKGQPTPQSNFIVQNELNVIAGMIRFNRDHCHALENKVWDSLDHTVELVLSCEGRRERRDNKPFPELFSNLVKELGEKVNELGPIYNEGYQANLKDMLDTIKANQENKKDEAPQA